MDSETIVNIIGFIPRVYETGISIGLGALVAQRRRSAILVAAILAPMLAQDYLNTAMHGDFSLIWQERMITFGEISLAFCAVCFFVTVLRIYQLRRRDPTASINHFL